MSTGLKVCALYGLEHHLVASLFPPHSPKSLRRRWRVSNTGEIAFDNLRKRDLITPCELTQNLVSVSGEPDGSVLAEIPPRGPNHCLQLLPLLRVEKPVTPALQFLGGGFFKRELIPGRQSWPVLWPRILSEPFTNPPVHHLNIGDCNLVTRSWH